MKFPMSKQEWDAREAESVKFWKYTNGVDILPRPYPTLDKPKPAPTGDVAEALLKTWETAARELALANMGTSREHADQCQAKFDAARAAIKARLEKA